MKTKKNLLFTNFKIVFKLGVFTGLFLLFLLPFMTFAQTPAFYNVNTSTGGNSFPLNSTSSNKVQWIYGPGVFNSAGTTGTPAGSGSIQKIYFRIGSTASSTATYSDFTISLAQNAGTSTTFSSSTYLTGLTQCFYQSSFTTTGATTNSWYAVTLQTPFSYDPSKSLIFELKVSAGTGNTVAQGGTGNQRIYGAFTSSSGTAGTGLVDFGFEMAKGPNDVGITALVNPTSVCGETSDPFVVKITNQGSNALSSGLGIPVTMMLSGVVSDTFTKSFNRALALGASDTIHMTTMNTATLRGLLNIKSWSAFSADTFYKNDTNLTKLTFIGSPSDQPTSLTLKSISNDRVNGTFTAAASAPSGYLVIRCPTGFSVTAPTNGVTYAVGATLGNGVIVQSSSATTFSALNLSAGTNYDFYVYSVNFCTGGPKYYTPNPLKGSIATKTVASSANNYLFGHSSGSTLDSMNGATSLLTVSNDDTPTSTSTNIGFNFEFEEIEYTNFWVSPDGILKLGGTSMTSAFTNGIGSTTIVNSPLLCPYWDDMATGTTGNVVYKVTGTSPNRILKVQWFVTIPRNTTGVANSKFQVWLYETSNKIEYRYGNMGAATMSSSVGIRGLALSPARFVSLTLLPLSATNVAANDANASIPLNGHLYSFTPPENCPGVPNTQPTSLVLNAVKGTSSQIRGSFTPANNTANSYLVVSYLKGATETPPVNGTYYYRGSSLGAGTVVSLGVTTDFIAQDLKDTTEYDFYIYSSRLCSAGPLYNTSSPLKGSSSTFSLVDFISTSVGGMWSSPETWTGGIVPFYSENAIIADGATVTVDQGVLIKNLTVGQGSSGILQWSNASFAMTVNNDITVKSGAKFLPFTAVATPVGQIINIGGNFTNNGYANCATATTALNFTGSQIGGSMSQVLSGNGSFEGDGTYGIIRTLAFQTTGSSSISTTQDLVTSTFALTAGSLNTNGKLTIDNTTQVYGQQLNMQVSNIVVTNSGVGYSNAPVVFGATATAWVNSGSATANTRYFSGNNVYVAVASGTFDPNTSPTHTSGVSTNGNVDLLWIGYTGTLGNPFPLTAVTVGTQYFYGDNLYVCTTAGTPSSTAPPTHTSGTASSGSANFLYVGTPASVSVNYNSTVQNVRSLTINNPGYGYSSSPTLTFNLDGGTVTTAATAVVVFFQQIIGPANSQTQKSGSATISGGLTINSTQGASRQTGVGAISTTNGGVNYSAAPSVGFTGPTGLNLVVTSGSGYTANPTITVTGGTLVSGTALTTSSFTITVNQGKVVSVYLSTPGTACYSSPPSLSFSTGTATVAFPTGCWPAATANVGANGQVTSFTVTNPGFGYVAAPTVGVGTTGTYTTVATAPTCRVGLYSVTYNNFIPSSSVLANTEGAEIPSNRKFNNLTLGSPGIGAKFNSDIELFGTAPLTLSSGVLDMGGSNLLFSWNGYAGTTGSLAANVTNASITLTTRGGGTTGSTLNFPFDATFSCFTGTGTAATGASVLTVKVTRTAAPSGGATGKRAYRVVTNTGSVYGTNPTVTLNWNSNDALLTDQARLFIAQSASSSGSWTVRSLTSGLKNIGLAATGSRTTATASPGPIVPTGDDYYAWLTTFTPPASLAYDISRTTGNTYNSILSTGSKLGWTGTSTDDQISPMVTIPSSTFKYQGQTVTGFNMCTNGFIKLITDSSGTSTTTALSNVFGGGSVPMVVAPFWEDLTTNPSLGTLLKLDSCNRYEIVGSTPGSRKIICEWFNYKPLSASGTNLNFQVVLDETDNSISFNYGTMQGYNGSSNFIYTYSCGIGGMLVNGTPLAGQLLAQQFENSTAFSHINSQIANFGANGLRIIPESFSSLKFTPGAYAGFSPPSTNPPSNDEVSGAINLNTVTTFPATLGKAQYSSRYATPSSNSVCTGLADDDVWFKFKATQPKALLRVYGSGGYMPTVQVLNSGLNPLNPSQCVVASAGGTAVDLDLSNLTAGQTYYVRVYHFDGGVQATATAYINSGGVVTSIGIGNGGRGYTAAASGSITTARVRFTGGGGNDAIGTAVLNGSAVSGITLNNGGYGYSSAPTITIESPAWAHTGEFSIVVQSKAPNDDCSTAKVLTGLSTPGCVDGSNSSTDNTESATPSSQASVCGTPDDDVWYKFNAINNNTLIKVSGSGSFDPAFQVFDAGVSPGNCGTLTSVQCVNSSGAGATDSVILSTTKGNSYFVRVYHAGTGSVSDQTFTICVTSGIPNCVSAPVKPSNGAKLCSGKIELSWPASYLASGYDIYLDTGAGPATTKISSNVSSNSLTVNLGSAKYSWRVVPKNIFGESTGCSDFNFELISSPVASFTYKDTCGGSSTLFTSTSTASGGTVTGVQWKFGDGSGATGNTASHTYANAGVSYTARIIATSSNGCVDSIDRSLFILSNLVSGSISKDHSICYNTIPNLLTGTSATGSKAPYFYQWQSSTNNVNFTDISGATTLDYQSGALTSSVYFRRAVTTASGCGPVYSNSVKVTTNAILTAGVIGSPQTICFNGNGAALTFSSRPTGAFGTYTYQWQQSTDSSIWSNISGKTDSTFIPSKITSVTFFRALVFSGSCPTAGSNGVKIKLFSPILGGTIASGQTICAGSTPAAFTQVSAPSGGPGTYTFQWQSSTDSINWSDISGATSSGYSPNALSTLTYFQRLAGNTGCPSGVSNTLKVRTNPKPTISFSASNHCFNDQMPLSNNSSISSGTLSYLWKFGDGTTSTSRVPNKTYGTSGTFNVTLVSTSNTGCKDSASKSVIVATTPLPNFSFNLKCLGDSVIFTDQTVYPCGISPSMQFHWNFGDGKTASIQNARHHYSSAGTYSVKFKLSLPGGYRDSITKTVVFNIRSTPSFTATNACYPSANNFSQTSSNYSSIAWSFGDGSNSNSGASSFTKTYANPGNYSVKLLTISAAGCRDSLIKTVSLFSKPTANFSTANNCLGVGTTFSNSSSGANAYEWKFGDGSVSTNVNPTHNYANAGTYTVTLRVISVNGCVDSILKSVTIYPNPTAGFTSSNVCLGTQTAFTNTSTGASTYSWNLGNGTISTSANPVYTYPGSGNYTVTLTATTSNGCSDKVSSSYTVYSSPTANFSASNVCFGKSISFVNSSSGASSSLWNFGDGTTSGVNSPSKIYGGVGNFDVKLKVTNSFGCVDSIMKSVTIYTQPVASFSAGNECIGKSVIFNNNSTGNSTNTWTFGDGNSSASQSPVHQYANSGAYNVKLSISNAFGCKDSLTKSITVFPKPNVSFTATPNPICRGGLMNFTNTTTNGASYTWNFGNGNSSTSTNPSNIFNVAGNYNVKLVSVSSNGCKDSASRTVTVWPRPTASFNVNNGCSGDNLSFASNSVGAVSHAWTFGDGNTSSLANPAKGYATAGTYNVRLIVTSVNGCLDTTASNVTVYPRATVSFTNPGGFCVGQSATFTNTSTLSSGNMTYQWNFGDGGSSSVSSPTYTYQNSGNFKVTLTASTDKGCINSNSANVLVYPKPTANFHASNVCQNATANFSNTSVGAISSSWDFGDAGTSTLTSPTHVYTSSGTYTVKLTVTNSNGCTDVLTKQVEVYSNPVANFTFVDRCVGQSTQFTNTSTGANDIYWQFGDGFSSNSANPFHNYGTPGIYNVTLFVESVFGCSNSVTKAVNVFALPKAAFSTNQNGQCINTNAFVFTDNSVIASGSYSRAWTLGDGGTSTAANPGKTYASPGNYTVKLVITSISGCKDSVQNIAMVYPKPTADFSINNAFQCEKGHLFVFTDASTITNGSLNRNWNFGDGTTAGGISALRSYASAGTYQVNLNVSSDYGCSDNITKSVTVTPNPVASFTTNDDIQCLNGNSFVFTNTSSGAASINSSWKLGDGSTITTTNASRTYSSAGTYRVSLNVNTTAGCRDSAYYTMKVLANPADVTISGPITASNGSTQVYSVPFNSGSSYNWVAVNGTVLSNGSNMIQVKWNASGASGAVSVTETGTNGCNGNPANYNVTLSPSASIANFRKNAFAAKVYPNPAKDQFIIEVATGDMVTMNMYDALGREVMSDLRFNNQVSLDQLQLAKGIYQIRLTTDKGKTTVLRLEIAD